MSKEANLITVRKWEKELNVDLDYDVKEDKVICMRCKVRKFWETRIKNKKNFFGNMGKPRNKMY